MLNFFKKHFTSKGKATHEAQKIIMDEPKDSVIEAPKDNVQQEAKGKLPHKHHHKTKKHHKKHHSTKSPSAQEIVALTPALAEPIKEAIMDAASTEVAEAEAPALVAEAPALVAEVPAPVAEVPAPVIEVPAPVIEVPAPVIEVPTAVTEVPTAATVIELRELSRQHSIVELLQETTPKAVHAQNIIDKRKSLEVVFSGEGNNAYGLDGRLAPDHTLTVTQKGIHYLTTAEAVAKMDQNEPAGKRPPKKLSV